MIKGHSHSLSLSSANSTKLSLYLQDNHYNTTTVQYTTASSTAVDVDMSYKVNGNGSSNGIHFEDPDVIRTRFSKAMSEMYRSEVPLYGDLIQLVHDVNTEALRTDPSLRQQLVQRHELGQ